MEQSAPQTKKQPVLTPRRLIILQLLTEYRFLTTGNVHLELVARLGKDHPTVQAKYPERMTEIDLRSLEILNMVRSFKVEPCKGNRSRLCWLLTSTGAAAVNFRGYHANYRRQPSRERIEFQLMQLELKRQLDKAGETSSGNWQSIRPKIYNSTNRLPEFTPQFEPLVEAVKWAEYQDIQQLQASDPHHPLLDQRWERFNSQLYKGRIPRQANDYLAYRQTSNDAAILQAVVLILCDPLKTGELFWKNRIKRYGQIARLIPVFGVFKTEAQARSCMPMLKEAGFRLTTVDKVGRLLVRLQE